MKHKVKKLKLYLRNTLSADPHHKTEFEPIDQKHIKMYVCGPTVYDRPHLGNARSAVVYDILFRTLSAVYPKVTYVRNITDIDDKIINSAKQKNQKIDEITNQYTKYYHDDIGALECLPPSHEPKATEYVDQMIQMIESLIKKGHAYVAEGHVLFAVDSFSDYGKLSNKSLDDLITGASERVEKEDYKQNQHDFVLWKPVEESAERGEKFDSPWGPGRPGWHIECSAMSSVLLGKTFDIHGGGADLKFPHHENEIAQSCCANRAANMANYWIHNGFLTVEGEKMSKSLNNFTTVRDLLDQGVEGPVIRLFYMTTHYHKPIDFSKKALSDSKKAYDKFVQILKDLPNDYESKIDEEALSYLLDDLNTPKVLALAHQLAASSEAERLADILSLLGINFKDAQNEKDFPDDVVQLAEMRKQARLDKDWAEADRLRGEIETAGYQIKDIAGNNYELS